MALQTPSKPITPTITWEALPADFVLPDDPAENIQQPTLAAALTDALGAADRIQPTMLIGSNFGLVATVNKKIVVKAHQRAEALAAKLRSLGVNPDQADR